MDTLPAIVVATFYKFVDLEDYRRMRVPLLNFCKEQGVRGSILLAQEGINATIAGPREGLDAVLNHLKSDPRMADLEHKESYADFIPFKRMKVRVKKEIVRMNVPEADPRNAVGTYVPPQEWNDLINDPDVILIDTRNDFEVEAGSFRGALDPNTHFFSEFPEFVAQNLDPQKHKKVAMFCTGGIRCEKATSFMVQQGFEEVYHLQGGILKYLEEIDPQQSMWDGECFVFDERVTVDHELQPTRREICTYCGRVIPEDAEECDCDKTSDNWHDKSE